jgi:PAS domain S-box-containing protein
MPRDQPPISREGYLEALLGTLADTPVFVYDRELRAVEYFWSGEPDPWGLAPDAFVGRRLGEIFDPEQAAPFDRALREVFETGQPRRFEALFGPPVGPRWFEVRISPIRAASGTVEQALTVSYDITERRRAAQALRESQQRIETLAEAIPIGIIWRDADGKAVFRNRIAERISGFSTEQLDREGWHQGIHPDDRATLARIREEMFRSPQLQEYEVRLVQPDGSFSWVFASSAPTFGDDGRFTGAVTTFIDITGRKAVEEALRESEHRFHSLADAMPIGVWRTDREPTVVYSNRRNWELLDVDPDEAEGRDLHALLTGMADRGHLESEESERLWEESERAVREAGLNPSRLRLRLADGKLRDLQTLAVPEFDSAGHFVGHVGVTIDVTDLTRAQEELARHRDDLGALVAERTMELERSYEALRRSERLAAVGTFAAGIAHQINNPVGAILLAGQFALEDPGNRERVEAALRDITTDARHCGRIVRGVLELAQGPTQDPRPCDLNQIVRACVRKLAVDCAERGAALRLELAAELPQVAGSEPALEQVLANLVYNSIEAAGREIVIGTRQAGEGIELVVRDDGCGIADENLDRIFDPLFTTRSSLGGTGLGLTLARGVVEAYGGSIDASSREAEGTQVIIRLKSATPAAPAGRPAS